jgi:hypothetical protein
MKKIFILFFIGITSFSVRAQESVGKPSIFLDCQMRCDRTYIKDEIKFVNYMRDRQEADIYILATRQNTGAGGDEIRLAFVGSNDYASLTDTITYYVEPDATDAVYREELVIHLKKGLLPYLAQSPIADHIVYSLDIEEFGEEEQEIDPWDYWVFSVGGNLYLNGEDQFSNIDFGARINVSRVTDASKLRLNLRYNYSRGKFVLTDGEEFINIQKTYNVNLLYVKSITDHFSVGIRSGAGSSTFGNTDFDANLRPALEYNVYPYDESSTRRFSFYYSIGPRYNNYSDTTIFNKLTEVVVRHGIEVDFEQTQKWGQISLEFGANQYLHDLGLYSMYINPQIEWNIFKGLNFNLGGYISFVGDRINIAKSDISDEDILLQIKQLDTDYSYFSYMGINYRFGSSYNNVVNSRF